LFLEVAALDRRAWGGEPAAKYTPDGEHAWRVWAEYSYLAVAMSPTNEVVGVLLGFDTSAGEHFLHKMFIDERKRSTGVGTQLLEHYCAFLDREHLTSVFSTAPTNTAVLHLSSKFGFVTDSLVADYYGPGKDRLLRRRAPQHS
jgi:phosphinothricin acetyltransferase